MPNIFNIARSDPRLACQNNKGCDYLIPITEIGDGKFTKCTQLKGGEENTVNPDSRWMSIGTDKPVRACGDIMDMSGYGCQNPGGNCIAAWDTNFDCCNPTRWHFKPTPTPTDSMPVSTKHG